jgi:peptidoglycan/xylan/chitin deacetylase (PgdA/CDA1 family)
MAFGALLKPALSRFAPDRFLHRGAETAPARVALTFDDGPDERHTQALLDVLARHDAHAAFFLQGAQVEKHPALVRAIHAAGHEVGNHAYSHRRPGEIGAAAYIAEVRRTHALLEDCVGAPVATLFRPPYGTMTLGTFVPLAREGFRFVHWSVDSGDSFIADATELERNVRGLALRGGDVMLFHDDQPQTLAAMPAILGSLAGRRLGFASIAELWRDA